MTNSNEVVGVFDKFLEFADISSVFNVLSRTEYIILWKIVSRSEKDAVMPDVCILKILRMNLILQCRRYRR